VTQGDVIATGSSFTNSGTDTSPALGGTATAGNLLVLTHYSGTNVNVNLPTGYTLGTQYDDDDSRNDMGSIFWKVADGTETDGTVGSTASNSHIGIIAEIEGPWGEVPTVGVTGLNTPDPEVDPSSGTTATAPSDDYQAFCAWFGVNAFRDITALSNSYSQAPATYEEQSSTKTCGMGISPFRSTAQTEECTATVSGSVFWFGIIFTLAPQAAGGFIKRKKSTAGRSGRAISPGLNNGRGGPNQAASPSGRPHSVFLRGY
jgi:hypothetical protein